MSSLAVVLFSGGRGSSGLAKQLAGHPGVELTVAINGYDDGASTGEVRRFLGDCLGPSDFRKNASHLARALESCPPALIDLLDIRLPPDTTTADARRLFGIISGDHASQPDCDFERQARGLLSTLPSATRAALARTLDRFERELVESGRPFQFGDCSLGNLAFAGIFLDADRQFNQTVDAYCALVGLRVGTLENVTDGANAFLVAIDRERRLLASEGDIVDAKAQNRIADIFLIDRPLGDDDVGHLDGRSPVEMAAFLEARAPALPLNPRLAATLATADLIIYAPGTQHSSLFPSYLTHGLCGAIAANPRAIKLLITNLQTDAEIYGSSAVDLIERAVYYLKEKGRRAVPTPCLITHYLINDPEGAAGASAYVLPGALDRLGDPRPVRIGNYEEGLTGRHDADKVVEPFVAAILEERRRQKVAVVLQETDAVDRLAQTVLEMARGRIEDLALDVTVLYASSDTLDPTLFAPLHLINVGKQDQLSRVFQEAVRRFDADFVILFDSSGRYHGEDIVTLASQLASGRTDGVWGSRRLSVRDIQASYRLRYQSKRILGAISYVGSHVLSICYLLLYGRYISDTLSGARATRASYALDPRIDMAAPLVNHHLLSLLLRDKSEVREAPVQFLPRSPDDHRVTVIEGLRALAAIFRWRVQPPRPPAATDPTASTSVTTPTAALSRTAGRAPGRVARP